MTRDALIQKYKHQLGGMVLDGLTHRDNAAKSLWVAQIMVKVEAVLSAIHSDMTAPTNGKPAPAAAKAATHEEKR